eukprot:scaffold38578_cov39-Prasinocladus_malaysianus.AAC.1
MSVVYKPSRKPHSRHQQEVLRTSWPCSANSSLKLSIEASVPSGPPLEASRSSRVRPGSGRG